MKALVLLSGGIDSTVCATLAVNLYGPNNVKALTMQYGQKHQKELEASKKVCEKLGIEREVMFLGDLYKGSTSSLIDPNIDHPTATYEELNESDELSPAYVPFRNGLLLSIATVVAVKENYKVILYGPHKELGGDTAYPDCSEDFNNAMKRAIRTGTGDSVTLTTPLQTYTKDRIVKLGVKINAPLRHTWTCYYNGDEQCGECPACRSRIHALEAAGINPKEW